ncbi:MAG: hypothetical protein JEZ11_01755 [Desulfobacterales bacterium]|nr:hypothetical protein [Desulfobacterales bacterium]
MERKRFQCFTLLILAAGIGILLLQISTPAFCAEKENHCFTCHTNARKLIEITRKIAVDNKDKPGASIETVGEG